MRPDISPMVGWETGRASEPEFMNMNLHAVRGDSSPPVVLYQFDQADPMNPLGLLIAYAEKQVKPVVSDFDTFTVGSRGMRYDPTPPKQVELIHWALDHTTKLLEIPAAKGWMGSWLGVIKEEARRGFHPTLPKYGFGDPTSYGLISDVIDVTNVCGAVRHGAECFNFYFPQELDDEFLVVWDNFADPPWRQLKEPDLRQFLLERAHEGFCFPINPVWPVRDPGWYDVLEALQQNQDGARNLKAWFPPESGVLERIEQIHATYPEGFQTEVQEKHSIAIATGRSKSMYMNMSDLSSLEIADFAELEVKKETKARWRRIRTCLVYFLQQRDLVQSPSSEL